MSENDLCDIYRVRNPDTVHFTWRRKTPFKQRRLDLFLISDSLQENIELVILATLESFGFGSQFIQWVKTFLNCAESCVINNGHSSGYFSLERGCRQGDPLSADLFIFCAEVLSIQIRENNDIHGIKIGDHEIKLSAYADYADFLTSDVSSLHKIFSIRATF